MTMSGIHVGMVQDPEALAKAIDGLRASAIFDDGRIVLSPHAEQFFLLAIAALDQAERYMKLAHYSVMKGE